MITLHNNDCLEAMQDIDDNSIDLILCDLPYGTTECKWDTVIDFDLLWQQYKRIIKERAAIVLFGSQPFTSKLVCSNLNWFRYEWIWNKRNITNPFMAKKHPLKQHENIVVFSKKAHKYKPIKTKGKKWHRGGSKNKVYSDVWGNTISKNGSDTTDQKYPKTIIDFSSADRTKKIYPTQKPVKLLEYFINTYTDANDLVLDNCMGSGSTGIAAINTKRNFIGIEKDIQAFKLAKQRLEEHQQLNLNL